MLGLVSSSIGWPLLKFVTNEHNRGVEQEFSSLACFRAPRHPLRCLCREPALGPVGYLHQREHYRHLYKDTDHRG